MWLFAGLGNPGAEYADSRHNIGFMAVEGIAHRYNFSDYKKKFNGLAASGTVEGEKVLLLKPATFMNKSGTAVLSAMSFYKIKPENIVVFHDDMDIALGKIKVKQGGGDAGHNGIKSIDATIGRNYTRVRIGVGKPEHKGAVVDYVLGDFNDDENDIKTCLFKAITDNISILIKEDMNKFASKIGEDLKKNGL